MTAALSICIPCYHSTDLVLPTLRTVLSQTYKNFEIIACNDSSDDHAALKHLLDEVGDSRIKLFANPKNLGYPGNLRRCLQLAENDLVLLLGHDDLLLGDDLLASQMQFLAENPHVGAIARPYYWFDEDPEQPIRLTQKVSARIISASSPRADLIELICATGQLSGLVFRKSLATHGVHDHVFTSHVYPFLSILRTHDIAFWPEFTVAVRTTSSQTRYLSTIYHPSPTKTWVQLFNTIFPEERFAHVREIGINYLCVNYLGLAQIKNYGKMLDLCADIVSLVRYRPYNLLAPSFWILSLGALLTPRWLLRRLVDWFKSSLLRRYLSARQVLTSVPPVAGSRVSQPSQSPVP